MTSAFRFFFSIVFLLVAAAQAPAQSQASGAAETNEESIKILLITSGCCHDYDFQTKAMQLALKKHGVAANWDIVNEGGKGTSAQIDLYNDNNWAEGYDLVIHNECFANTTDTDYIKKITEAHKKGVNLSLIHI